MTTVKLLLSQHAHPHRTQDLLVSYNISVDAQQRKRQHLASVANKVGLQMPDGFAIEDPDQ